MTDVQPRSLMGAFIRQQRELSQMSMRQMSQIVGISNPYLSQIERGLRAPSATVTAAIATTLGITVEELYERSGSHAEPGRKTEVRQAIERASELGPLQRASLLGIYESFITVNQARRIMEDGQPDEASG
ncbi:helix-turn-helix transcriptional regulator [Ammonicoccus fulvus]|uniref:Helix-turn-helix transcriptional regulator n=1 Tax=Ammonicoccus fulvus TaxID=3138240 RepID=A0ABZ3FNP5_9ACTN